MMDLKASYARDSFKRFVQDEFLPDDYQSSEQALTLPSGLNYLTEAVQLGESKLLELKVFEVRHDAENDPRIGISKDLFRLLGHYGARRALVSVISGDGARYRLSLVTAGLRLEGKKVIREYSNPRRFTFILGAEAKVKNAHQQLIKKGRVSDSKDLVHRFSIDTVTDEFYGAFVTEFNSLVAEVRGRRGVSRQEKEDFALLLVLRLLFLGFVQKRGWLGNDTAFLQNYLVAYRDANAKKDSFYGGWLKPLFLQAAASRPGTRVIWDGTDAKKELDAALLMTPNLGGEIFRELESDRAEMKISDGAISKLFSFVFSYNFTIEENNRFDEELELNPEFLGIIFERLVNKENGAVYTPRTEVDLMCRMALVQWLAKVNTAGITKPALYELFFPEDGPNASEKTQKFGEFNEAQLRQLVELVRDVKVCDPAVGSGAFPVGMMHIIDEIEQSLQLRIPGGHQAESLFDRKKRIISSSLYGVEVAQWAVWICQLRLWLSLFIDAPDEAKKWTDPIMPGLDFKIRRGDSVVQRIGSTVYSVHKYSLPPEIKQKVRELAEEKTKYFANQLAGLNVRQLELNVFAGIIDDATARTSRDLDQLKASEQTNLFGESEKPKPLPLDDIASLERELELLKEQRRGLKGDPPIIWNISFSEIFGERGGFDIVIGNPPYIGSGDIADPDGVVDDKDYRAMLKESAEGDFPLYFRTHSIDGKSDLYTYFYLRGLRLLNAPGVHVFICSKSWLDAGFGAWLQEFLLSKASVRLVFDNQARRSFSTADVNTIISVIGAPEESSVNNEPVRFCAIRKPFEEVLFSENLISIEDATTEASNDFFRILPVAPAELRESGIDDAGEYHGGKWGGVYLRAPSFVRRLLSKEGTHRMSPGKILIGERYLNTGGADGFFILTDVVAATESGSYQITNSKPLIDGAPPFRGAIERKYLQPLIKGATRQTKKITIDKADAYCVVIDKAPSSTLKKYIAWGEKQGYNERSVTSTQKPWYKPTRQMLTGAPLLAPRSYGESFAFYLNPHRFLSLRFYRLFPKDESQILQIAAYFNSTLFWLLFESLGNTNLGLGALGFSMDSFLSIPIPVVLSDAALKPFSELQVRQIENIFDECGIDPESQTPISEQVPNPKPDRRALDDVVFDALGLGQSDRTDTYRALCQLVWDRLSRAESTSTE